MVRRIACIWTPLAHKGATCLTLTDDMLYSGCSLLRVFHIVKGERLVTAVAMERQNDHAIPLKGHTRAFPGIQGKNTVGRDADLLRGRRFIDQQKAHSC